MSDDDLLSSTGVVKKKFGRFWPAWLWVSHQFSPTSLGAIGLVIVTAWGYISHLNSRVASQETHITVLETRVVPAIQSSERIAGLDSKISSVSAEISGHEGRLRRIEDNLDLDYNEHMKQEREQRAQRKRK